MTWVEQGDVLNLQYINNSTPTVLTGYIIVEGPPGIFAPTEVFITSFSTGHITTGNTKPIGSTGLVVGAGVSGTIADKRGRLWASLNVNHRTIASDDVICKGYVYTGNSLGMGEFSESTSPPGRIVTNEGNTTLLNNTAATRTITVPANTRWLVYGGSVLNADDVTRSVAVMADDGTDELVSWRKADLVAATRAAYPSTTADDDNGPVPFPLVEADRILITWGAGGASAGGTAKSSVEIEELLEV